MNKNITSIVLPAVGDGWDVWTLGKSQLELKTHIAGPLDKSNVPLGACVAFPVSCVATLPICVPSDDPELYKGAAEIALEKAGLLNEVESGKCWDCLVVEKRGNEVIVAASALVEDRFDNAHRLYHTSFDSSARCCRPAEMGDALAFWQEHGEWVMACYRDSEVFYTEPLGQIDESLDRTLDLLISQFLMKGIRFHPQNIWCWTQPENEVPQALLSSSHGIQQAPRPKPELPEKQLCLQPVDVVQWHGRQAVRMRNQMILMAVAALYLCGLGYLWWRDYQLTKQITELDKQVAFYQPTWESNNEHFARWDELSELVSDRWPLNLYRECAILMPSDQSIRFQQIEVQEPLIVVRGNSINLNAIAKYSLGLKRSEYLTGYVWTTPSETRDPKTNQWTFRYEAKSENSIEE